MPDPSVAPTPHRVHRRRSGRVAALLAGLTIVAVTAPAIVLAATFLDVPVSSSFYAPIEKVAAARITAGCGGGNYCPKANVTREQMAAFLARIGGTAEQGDGGAALSLESGSIIAEVQIRAGDLTGGTAYVQLYATFGAFTDDPDAGAYPYKAIFALADATGPFLGNEHYLQIDQLAGDGFGDDSGAVQVLVAVPTGVNMTFQLIAGQLAGTEGGLAAYGTLDALYVPFSAGGGWADPNPQLTPASHRELTWLRDR